MLSNSRLHTQHRPYPHWAKTGNRARRHIIAIPARTERRVHHGWIVAAVSFATLLTTARRHAHGVKPSEISEIITYLAMYTG